MTADGHQPYVLIINDTHEIIDLLAELPEEEGYRVSTSLALLDIDKVKALAPDVIVQDLLFGGMQETGWKFLQLVRLDPELARIPVILCTAAVRTVTEPEMAEQLDRLGVSVVLVRTGVASASAKARLMACPVGPRNTASAAPVSHARVPQKPALPGAPEATRPAGCCSGYCGCKGLCDGDPRAICIEVVAEGMKAARRPRPASGDRLRVRAWCPFRIPASREGVFLWTVQ